MSTQQPFKMPEKEEVKKNLFYVLVAVIKNFIMWQKSK